ncbi:hypothetical protein IAU60_000602 [Kwoniella sp. DSM 27419]
MWQALTVIVAWALLPAVAKPLAASPLPDPLGWADEPLVQSVSVGLEDRNTPEDDCPCDEQADGNGLPESNLHGTLQFKLGEHTRLSNSTFVLENRSSPSRTITWFYEHRQEGSYLGEWTFTSYTANEHGNWGPDVGESQLVQNMLCHVSLSGTATAADQVVLYFSATGEGIKTTDDSKVLDLRCIDKVQL